MRENTWKHNKQRTITGENIEYTSVGYKNINIKLNSLKNWVTKWAEDMDRCFTKEDTHMANKHMKKCSTLFLTRIMQMKTTLSYQQILTWSVKKKKIVKTPNAGMDGGKLDNSHLPSRYVKWYIYSLFLKWHFLKNLSMQLSNIPAITLLSIYTIKIKLTFTQKPVHSGL